MWYNLYLHPYQSESFIWRERSKLDSETQFFLKQKKEFEEEKQKFMEAVHTLDREVSNSY